MTHEPHGIPESRDRAGPSPRTPDPETSLPPADAADQVAIEFLAAHAADRESGTPRSLAEYLGRIPGHDLVIAREYLDQNLGRAGPVTGGGTSVHLGTGFALPDRLGPYAIERELGRGGQAVVYLAEDLRLRRTVALKVLTSHEHAAPEAIDRFRREAGVTARIDHPGVCAVYDAGTDNGVAWIAMRYVEGETLARRIRTTRDRAGGDDTISTLEFPEPTRPEPPSARVGAPAASGPVPVRREILRVVEIIEKTARALHAAHEAGIIHRDVKPGNIMLPPAGDPVVLDFGLARDLEGDLPTLTRPGDIFGTPHYMSPEQIAAHRVHLDRRTDIYSLGIVLYECLTLRRPFEAQTREGLYQAILTKDPPSARQLNRAVPRDLAVVAATAMARDRDRRYQTALDFAEDLRRVREHLPIQARPRGVLVRAARGIQRHPVATAASVLFLAAAVTAAAVLGSAHARSRELLRLGRGELAAAALALDEGRVADARAALMRAIDREAPPEEIAAMLDRISAASKDAERGRIRRTGDEIGQILDGMRSEIDDTRRRMERHTTERAGVARNLEESRRSGAPEDRIRTLELQTANLDLQIDDERSQVAQLEAAARKLQALSETMRREEEAVKALEAERETMRSALDRVQGELAMADRSRREAEAERDRDKARLAEFEREGAVLGKSVDAARGELAALQQERDRLATEVNAQSSALDEAKNRLGRQEELAAARIRGLTEERDRLRQLMAVAGAPTGPAATAGPLPGGPAPPAPALPIPGRHTLRNGLSAPITILKMVVVRADGKSVELDPGPRTSMTPGDTRVVMAPPDIGSVTVSFQRLDGTGKPAGPVLEKILDIRGPGVELILKE